MLYRHMFIVNSKKLIEASLAMNIKILKIQNEKMKVEPPDPVPSSSQSVHGTDIKVEELVLVVIQAII